MEVFPFPLASWLPFHEHIVMSEGNLCYRRFLHGGLFLGLQPPLD
jgi:hypothetical protein